MDKPRIRYTAVALKRRGSTEADAIAIANRKRLTHPEARQMDPDAEEYSAVYDAVNMMIGSLGEDYSGKEKPRNVQAWVIKDVDGVRTARFLGEHEQTLYYIQAGNILSEEIYDLYEHGRRWKLICEEVRRAA